MTHCNIDFENIKRYWTSFGSLRKNGKNIILFIFHVFYAQLFLAMTPPMHLSHQTLSCGSHSRWAKFFNFRPIQVLSGLLTISLIIGATRMILDSLASSHSPDEFGWIS
jgi:hypothetical protein